MADSNEHEPLGPNLPFGEYRQVLSNLTNAELLSALDLGLLELERRLLKYAKVGPEVLEMADEGFHLAVRARARLGPALSSVQHAEGRLQIVGVGEWRPNSTRPGWDSEPGLSESIGEIRPLQELAHLA